MTICNNNNNKNNKNNNKNNNNYNNNYNNKNNNNNNHNKGNNNTFMITVTNSNLIISGQCSDYYKCCKCCQ